VSNKLSLSLETVRSNWLKLRSMRQSPDRGLDWVHFPAEVGDLLIILLCTTIYSFTHFVNLSSKAAVLYTEEPAGPAIGKHRVNKTSNANQTF